MNISIRKTQLIIFLRYLFDYTPFVAYHDIKINVFKCQTKHETTQVQGYLLYNH